MQLQAKVEDAKNPPPVDDDEDVFVIIGDHQQSHVSHLFDKDFQELDLRFTKVEDPSQEGGDDSRILVPRNKRLRPFFFMRQIEKTITQNDGAFLTESVFVPRYVWYQKDAKVQDVENKLSHLEALKKEF